MISTEAEIIYDVTSAKTTIFLRSIIWELAYTQESPTPIYEENDPTVDIVNSSIPTVITRHINFRLFDIQVWKEAGYIIIHLILRIINPMDYLTKPLD